MGANFGRLKNWVRERLKYSDLNGEFNNILNNFTPAGMDDASETVSDMRSTVNPAPYVGGVQTESLATSLLGELQRMRFVMQRFFGTQYWYSDPGRNFATSQADVAGMIPFSGQTQAAVYRDFISRGGIVNAASLSTADVLAADFDGTNKKFGNFSYDLGAGNIMAFPNKSQEIATLSMHFRNLSAGDYLAYNPLLGISLYLDSSTGFLTARVEKATSAVEGAKDVKTIAGSVSRAGNTSFAHAGLRYQLGNILGSSTDAMNVRYNGSSEGSDDVGDNILMNPGRGGVWFFGAKRNDPAWDKFSSMSVEPDAEVTAPWTATGNAGDGVATDGVLAMDVPLGDSLVYSKTTNINLAAMTIDTKFRLRSLDPDIIVDSTNLFTVQDASMGSIVRVKAYSDRIVLDNGSGGFYTAFVDTSEWHAYRLTSLGGSPVTKFYIDGVLVISFTNLTGGVIGADSVNFGVPSAGNGISVDYERFAYYGSGASVYAPVDVSATGELADILVSNKMLADTVMAQLVNNSASSVVGGDVKGSLSLAGDKTGSFGRTGDGVLTNAEIFFASDGETPIEFNVAGAAASTAANTKLEVFQDDVFLVENRSVGISSNLPVAVAGKRIYKLGLRKLSLSYDDFSNTGTNGFTGTISVSKG